MMLTKILNYLMIIITLISLAFGVGLYDNSGEFNYYVHNSQPTINTTVISALEELHITHAELNYNGNTIKNDFKDIILQPNSQDYTISIPITDFGIEKISKNDKIKFKLFITKKDGAPIKPKGDPNELNIIYDNNPVIMNKPLKNLTLSLTNDNRNLGLLFNKKIFNVQAFSNNQKFLEFPEKKSSFEKDYSNSFSYTFPENTLNEGLNSFTINFKDFAENENSENIQISYRGKDLEVELLTRKDESNLKYYYNKEFSKFFNNKIYFSEDNYELKVKTSKKAKCFFSQSRTSFGTINQVKDKTEFSTEDGIIHTYDMTGQTQIWIACQNTIFSDDVTYLNDALGMPNSLIKLEKYNYNFEISSIFPNSLVSGMPIDIIAKTTNKAICKYSLNSQEETYFNYHENASYTSHTKTNLNLFDGNQKLKINCFDKIYNTKSKEVTIKVDSKNGPKLVEPALYYTNRQSSVIDLTFSENATCKISSKQEDVANFNSLQTLSGSALIKSFTPQTLTIGENKYYTYCEKEGEIYSSIATIIFDPNPPKITNITFYNKNIASDWVGLTNELEFKIKIEGLIPIKKYFGELEYINSSTFKNFTSNSGSFKGKIKESEKLKFSAINILDSKSTIFEKKIKIDLDSPIISFIKKGETKRQITCTDSKSGCYQIKYGLSQTAIDCIPNKNHNISNEIETLNSNYLCVKAIDFAGNEIVEQELIGFSSISGGGNSGSWYFNDSMNQTENDNSSNSEIHQNNNNNEKSNDDPFGLKNKNETEDKNTNYLIIAAIVIVLLGSISGGSYYSYKKGYLDKQLERFGIHRQNENSQKTINEKQKTNFNISNPLKKESNNSKYDRNLKKINSFIDETLNKGDDIFDKFSNVGKGNVENYEDTLIKNKHKDKNKKTINKDKKINGLTLDESNYRKSIEKEAEEFESYIKDKKKGKNKKD